MKGRTVFVCLLSLLLPPALFAQNSPDNDPDGLRGYVDNVFHHSSVDSVNLYNGMLTIPIALGPSYPVGPKLKFQAMLSYSARFGEFGHPASQTEYYKPYAGDPALGLGWTFTLGAIKNCGKGFCYIGMDGSQHIFDGGLAPYYNTNDGAQLVLHDLGGGGGPWEMWDGDGNRYDFSWQVAGYDDPLTDFTHDFGRGRDGYYLRTLTDPFGNGFTVNYRQNVAPCVSYSGQFCEKTQMVCPALTNSWIPQSIVLPTGTITIATDANNRISSFNFPASGGGSGTWTLAYQSFLAGAGCLAGSATANLWVISHINLPDGLGGWSFDYSMNCFPGFVNRMTLPTLGTIDYWYGPWSFYHGRVAALSQTCSPLGPDQNALVEVSYAQTCDSPHGPAPSGSSQSCDPLINPNVYLDQPSGVARRVETVNGEQHQTDYTQFAFPFGENGTAPGGSHNCDGLGRCGPQSLTVVVFPADKDGRRRAHGTLFWSAPKGNLATYSGDRTGADIEERVFDTDPTQSYDVSGYPVCGGTRDNPFCANHAVRVIQRTYEYDIPSSEIHDRRLLSEITYHQAPAANDVCSGCKYHQVSYSNNGSDTWEGNGRHYDVETNTGNLGNDSRTITTTWTPANWTTPPVSNAFSLPNLMSQRTESDGSTTLYKYFEYKTDSTANGFLIGSAIWDSGGQRTFLSCSYNDGHGNVGQQFSATYPNQTGPPNNACQTAYPSFPTGAVGINGDAFGKIHTYQNGLLVTSRWMATPSTPANWYLRNYVRDPGTGWVTFSSDTTGLTTGYQYDSIGRVTLITPPGGEASTVVGYPLTTRTTATRNGGTGLSTYQQYEYDGLGRLSRDIHQMPGINQFAVRTHAYDGPGRRYFDSEWAGCTSGTGDCLTAAPGGTTSTNFDPFGRPQTMVRADGSTTNVSFADSYSSYSDTKKMVTVNNLGGACTGGACTGGSAPQTTYVSDAWGRTTGVTEPGGDQTSYSYDVNGKLKTVTQSQQGRTFTFDPAGFLRQETTPEKGTVNYTDYGSLGNVMRETEPDGVVRENCYDFAGRVTETRTSEGGASPLCSYESGGPQGRLYQSNVFNDATGDNSLGKLTIRTAWNYPSAGTYSVSDTYVYNGLGGRVSSQTTAVSGGSNLTTSQGWFYNGVGLPAHHYHARSSGQPPFVVSYDYDAGLPVKEYANGIPVVTGVGYQASGALAGYVTGLNVGHDVTTAIGQDTSLLPRPSSISTTGATANFVSGSYSYDGAGNIMAIGPDGYGYDLRSRLTSAALSGSGSQAFSYDRYGNLLSKTGTPGNTTLCTVSCTNNRLPGNIAAYDGRGNMTANLIAPGGSESYSLDGLDRLITHQGPTLTWDYLYDGESERIAKVLRGGGWTYTFRDEGKRVSSEFGASNPSRDNVFLGNLLAVSYASIPGSDRVWTFYSSDHLGTPRLITDITAAMVETPKNWPFGENVTAPGPFQRIRFASMERDTEASRYHDHARGHEFNLGRFLSPDRAVGRPKNPQAWNRYAYALDNPLRFLDPDGNVVVGFTGLGNSPKSALYAITGRLGTQQGFGPAQVFRWQEIANATAFVLDQLHGNGAQPVIIAGFSRGAASAVELAERLGKAGVTVTLLLTVDPVMIDPKLRQSVPSNVARSVNYYRNDDTGLLDTALAGTYLAADDPENTSIENRRIFGSHRGAIGVVARDQKAIDELIAGVRRWQEQQRREKEKNCAPGPEGCNQ